MPRVLHENLKQYSNKDSQHELGNLKCHADGLFYSLQRFFLQDDVSAIEPEFVNNRLLSQNYCY